MCTASRAGSEPRTVLTRFFDAPRELVFAVWTDRTGRGLVGTQRLHGDVAARRHLPVLHAVTGRLPIVGNKATRRQEVSRDQWLWARRAMLLKEKAHTRRHDKLTAAIRALPWVRIDKP